MHFTGVRLPANNSFKPKLLRSGNGVAGKACHAATCTTQFGLTQALGGTGTFMRFGKERELRNREPVTD